MVRKKVVRSEEGKGDDEVRPAAVLAITTVVTDALKFCRSNAKGTVSKEPKEIF